MDKWLNPPSREKEPQKPKTIGKEISFDTIKKQVGKKPVYGQRYAEDIDLPAEKVGIRND